MQLSWVMFQLVKVQVFGITSAVIRSEEETIEIGQETNIEDQCVLHTHLVIH